MPEPMVWPPPTIQAKPEGEASQGGAGEAAAPVSGKYGAAPSPGSPLPPDWLERPESLIGTVLSGRYRITGLLGRGPMAIACEGESSRGRRVTLKLIPRPPELSVERFAWQLREALAMAHFDHENVVASTDFGALEDGGAFVSRSRVPGVPLRALLRQGGLPLRRALDIARQIAAAVAAAHAQEILHGRLKPENALVQSAGNQDVVKVVDFGMSQLPVDLRVMAAAESEVRRSLLRTRVYLPNPHLPGVAALPPTPSVDVYSLGVMLFEMIAGQPPFVFEGGSWRGPQGGPFAFAQCTPPVYVPPAAEELVNVLLRPEGGISAGQALTALESLLGRPSVAPPAPRLEPEPVTSQHPSLIPPPANPVLDPPRGAEMSPWPPVAVATDSQRTSISTPPRVPSWPPLPPGVPGPSLPAGPPGSYPPPPLGQGAPGFGPASAAPAPAPAAPDFDVEEAEFRPSLLARLRRMFGRSKPDGEL